MKKRTLSVKALITDVDGVLTDGGIIYDAAANEFKRFNAKDGLIVRHLQYFGFRTGLITGRDSAAVRRRAEELSFEFVAYGAGHKIVHWEQFKQQFNLLDEEIAYIGDDLNDMFLLKRAGFSACPADAPAPVRAAVDYVCQKNGGQGAYREFADRIIDRAGLTAELLQKIEAASLEKLKSFRENDLI